MATVTSSIKMNKAFVLSLEDIRYFYDEAKRFMENNSSEPFKMVVIGVFKNIETISVRDVPDSILNYSNPRSNEISGIAIRSESEDKEYSFELYFENIPVEPPVHLAVGGKTIPEVEPCFRKLEAELKERTRWYSFLSNRVWIAKWSWILLIISALLIVSGLISTFTHASRLKKAKTEITAIVNKYKKSGLDPNENEIMNKAVKTLEEINKAKSYIPILRGILYAIGAFFAVKCIEKFIHYLFPRVVFEIGAGMKRHQNIQKLRKHISYWGMSLFIGIILIIIAKNI